MCLSSIVSEIKRYIGRKSQFFIPTAFSAPVQGEAPSVFRHNLCTWEKL